MKKLSLYLCLLAAAVLGMAQVTGSIRGKLTDSKSGEPVPFATVKLLNTDPLIGGVSSLEGELLIENVPVGRYDIEITYVGYQQVLIREFLVTSGKDAVLNAELSEEATALEEVVITASVNKLETVNPMAGISAKMLSVEEANRYAGGFDDPARLASSFAGVASGVQNNGIVIRGNNPNALLWRMEGVEIANPNHFADLDAFGGGGITALSSQMMANSDFLMGAFPAAYSNAISGVFDLSMRQGNSDHRENTLQVGLLGIDLSSEGPLSKERKATYLFNYRYSMLGLLEPILPENSGGTNYQDLSFKFKLPTKSLGVFSFWGLGLIDNSGSEFEQNIAEWKYRSDQEQQDVRQYMGSSGLKNIVYLNNNSFLETDIAVTTSGLDLVTDLADQSSNLNRDEEIENRNATIVTQTQFNKQFANDQIIEVGARAFFKSYNLFLANREDADLNTVIDDSGSTLLFSAFGQTKLTLTDQLSFQGGLNFQHFKLNGQSSFEPRASFEYITGAKSTVGLSYGLHSRAERLNYYLNRDENGIQQNRNMKMTRSHHLVGTFRRQISENIHFKIEPYYQFLFDVPVLPGSSFSFINLENDWFINDRLENTGEGENYGVDLTLERFMSQGLYYVFTSSIFKSRYRGGDGIWRNTAFDRGFVINALAGKEWFLGSSKSNVLGVNLRSTYQGGQRFIPFDEEASLLAMDAVDDESNAYRDQLDASLIMHLTISYRKNKPKRSSVWTLSLLNLTMVEEFEGFDYNQQEGTIDRVGESLIIPNISYKLEF